MEKPFGLLLTTLREILAIRQIAAMSSNLDASTAWERQRRRHTEIAQRIQNAPDREAECLQQLKALFGMPTCSPEGDELRNWHLLRALQRAREIVLPLDQEIEFLSRRIYLGWPRAPIQNGPGRRATRTQYDAALDRRKDRYRRLVKLPKARAAAKAARLAIGDQTRAMVLSIVNQYPGEARHQAIANHYAAHPHSPRLDERTIRRILRKADASR